MLIADVPQVPVQTCRSRRCTMRTSGAMPFGYCALRGLWLACYHGSHAIIEKLIAAGIDIDLQNGNGAPA